MNLAIPLSAYNPKNIFLCGRVRNTIVENSTFARLLFSNHYMTTIGIHLQLNVVGAVDEPYYQKLRTIFKVEQENEAMVRQVVSIENNILDLAETGKSRVTKLSDQLRNGILRSSASANWQTNGQSFVLKITGIWETDTECGVTYKVSDATRL